jgi:hypothetical protein
MNNRAGSQTTWNYIASPPLGAGRDEQYLFLWNMKVFQSYAPDGTNYWRWDYPLPGGQTGNYGFPRPSTASPDMPPMTMFFKLGTKAAFMPVSVFHAPDWSLGETHGQGILAACTNIPQIADFALGQGGLIMGTFNVPANDDVNTQGSNGAGAFAPLAGAGGKYTQAMNNQPNLLANAPLVALAMEEAIAQTSDNFFFRRDGATNGITLTDPGVPLIFQHSLGTLNSSGSWVSAPLGSALASIEAVAVGMENVTAAPDGSYVKLDDAFTVYRAYVSSYLPVMGTLNY